MIKAVIFDMDGLLIDSEPLWHRAGLEVYRALGIPMTDAMLVEVMGMRLNDGVHYWHLRYPWKGKTEKDAEQMILDRMVTLIREEAELMPGAMQALEFFRSHSVPLALASSSYYAIINAVVDKLAIRPFFQVIHSAEDEEYGKPHPAIWLTTAKKLGVDNGQCLAIEDSFNGVLSAKAAKMSCIAVPNPRYSAGDKRFIIADRTIGSLAEIGADLWKSIQ